MKANVILGKKQIVIAALVLILGAAVYLNWQFADVPTTPTAGEISESIPEKTASDTGGEESLTETNGETQQGSASEESAESSGQKVLGEASFVNAQVLSGDAYFASARLARSKARDEAIATISAVLGDEALTEDDKKEASAKAMSITDAIEAESRIENLIKAKGFADCMVYITEQSASVVVKSDGLTQDQATQIKNIVVSEGSIKGENISITEIK